jgi:ribosomal protein S18 acetylase RimI-like enzyme
VARLQVRPHQERFLPANGVTIGQALLRPGTWLRAVYAGDQPVGLVAVVEDVPAPGSFYLWRLMVDGAYQGRGFGARALDLVVREFSTRAGARDMHLKYLAEPGSARSFYQRAGFADTGVGDERDSIMTRALAGGTATTVGEEIPC